MYIVYANATRDNHEKRFQYCNSAHDSRRCHVTFFLAHTVEWMPTVHQVLGTLPTAFQDKFPTMYLRAFAITDDSEIFNEMPLDLHMQSSMWSGVTTSITALPSS